MSETYLSFPFRLTAEGGVASADADAHVRQRLEQILFTAPGERVMLPEFGCGVRELLFAGNDAVLAAAAEFRVARALQTHMGREVLIHAVDVTSDAERLVIEIVYTRARDLERQKAAFELSPFEAQNRA